MPTASRRVDFIHNEDDFRVAILGLLGLSTQAIMDATGLSFGQVIYRLGKGHIRRAEYRSGRSPAAKYIANGLAKGQPMRQLTMLQLHKAGVDKSPYAERHHLKLVAS